MSATTTYTPVVLEHPVTHTAMDTGSYAQFAEGYFLSAKTMAWFWDCYCPDLERRSKAFASPLPASVSVSAPASARGAVRLRERTP